MKKRTWRGLTILLAVALLISVLAVTAFAEGADPLPKVKLTSIAPYSDGIVIRWEAVEEAELYEVYSKCEDGEWAKLANTGSTAYKDTTAENNRIYSYTVLARSGDRVSPWNEENCLTVKKGLDDVVMGEPQPHVTGNIIRWNAVENAAFYQVYRLNPGETTWTLLKNTSSTAYKDATAEIGIKYYYKVRARNGGLMSSMNIQSVSAMRPIGNVKMGETTSHYTGNIVRWEAVDGAKTYNVYRLPSGGSAWSLLTRTGSTAYKDTSAGYGAKYYYKVVAVCNNAVGSLNNVGSVSAARPPENVRMIGAQHARDGIHFSWNAAQGADKYEVLRRVSGSSWEHLAYTRAQSYTDTSGEWGKTYYYTVRAMAGSVMSAGYDSTGVSGTFTLDEYAIEDLIRSMNRRIDMESSGNYDLDEMIDCELSYLEPYMQDGYIGNEDLEAIYRAYYKGLQMQRDALSKRSVAEGEVTLVDGYLACSKAACDFYNTGLLRGDGDNVQQIREHYVETLPGWEAMSEAYHALYDDIYAQLVGTEWNISGDGSYLYRTYTNNTSYTITTDFYVDYYQGDSYVGICAAYTVSNLAPGKTATIKVDFPSNADSFGVDWSHVKISKDSTVIVDFS